MGRSTLEIGAAQLRSVTEIAPKSPFLYVIRSPTQYLVWCEHSYCLLPLSYPLPFALRRLPSKTVKKKCTFYLSVNVLSTKVLIGDTIFYVANWRRDRHFTWSSEPREGLACCSAKGVPSFLGYFKTLSIGPAPGIEPATSRSAVNTLYRLS